MGLRDWFTSSAKNPKPAEREAEDTPASEDKQAFAALQNTKTEEALSLFEEDEPEEASQIALDAPYDASGADVEDLLTEGEESFTHHDEVSIADVNDLEDPYLTATIVGDVPEAVVFDDEENDTAV